MIHALGPPLERSRQDGGEARGLFAAETAWHGSVIGAAGRLCAVYPRTPFDHVEVEFQNALLAENEFSHRHECKFRPLAEDGAAGTEEKVLYQLLRYCGRSAHAATFHIVFSVDLDLVPVEPMVLVEARILGGDDSVLEIRRDLADRNKRVAFVIWRVVNPSLHVALDVHGGCRWVDPSCDDKHEHRERPKQSETESKQQNKGAKETAPLESFDSQG
jgi:hypothetical protein